jgi:transposase InsO family protein
LFYRWRKLYGAYGPDGLHPKRRRARRGRPTSVPVHLERQVLALALAWPSSGPQRLSDDLAVRGIQLAPSTIHRILKRVGLSTRTDRFGIIEAHTAERAGLLTERTRRKLARARSRKGHRIQADQPGELVSVDCFYIGKLKGVGKVWQITACDVASSFGFAQILPGPAPTSKQAADFIERVVLPGYKAAGWTLQRVLTDGGSEFWGDFISACQRLRVRHTRTKPRHCWTNGVVERFQGTILHEHWRIAFRRRYFTSRRQLQRSLESFLSFYNHHRPHRGYRLKGKTPASVFVGALG